ncbi:MAG: rhomboid family intramembrane serine protease [Propioniciclava sp.]|uniref:rhomboid family intramembrane serine protease n=1 Tax=Propioniciclava sp. TaxID=2038686 RepID=UPI0039E4FFA2
MTSTPPSGPDFQAQPPQGWPPQEPPPQGWPPPPAQGPSAGWQAPPPTWPPPSTPQPSVPPPCAYHADRAAGVRCQRCGNPICGECMVEAPVGFQCRACVAQGMALTRQAEGPFGGRRSANPALTSLVLIGLNVAVWLAILLAGGGQGRLTGILALTPGGICDLPAGSYVGVSALQCAGAGGTFLPGPLDGGWWQIVTNAFTHVDLLHLAMNMLALWFIGPMVERVLGRTRFLAVYGVSLLTASVFVLLLSAPETSTLGASGAISGLMGALLVLVLRLRGNAQSVLMWIGINVVITIMGSAGISWQGHLGGFLGGIATTLVIIALHAARARARRPQP